MEGGRLEGQGLRNRGPLWGMTLRPPSPLVPAPSNWDHGRLASGWEDETVNLTVFLSDLLEPVSSMEWA